MTLQACKTLESRLENVLALAEKEEEMSTAEIIGTLDIVKFNFAYAYLPAPKLEKDDECDDNDNLF